MIPSDDAPHLLVVDDDSRIRSLLKRYLSNEGFRVTIAENAATARRKLNVLSFELLIVDIMMPDESGFELTKDLRKTEDVPILMLTARADIEDRIEGLEIGADDYLSKPFEPRELVLRIHNILKRGTLSDSPTPEIIRFGPYIFQYARGELKSGEQYIRLTERERELLRIFAQHANATVPRHELTQTEGITGERTIDVQINRLRRKIEPDPSNPIYLQTVRGTGYRLILD